MLIGNAVCATTLSAVTIARYSTFLPTLVRSEAYLSREMAPRYVTHCYNSLNCFSVLEKYLPEHVASIADDDQLSSKVN